MKKVNITPQQNLTYTTCPAFAHMMETKPTVLSVQMVQDFFNQLHQARSIKTKSAPLVVLVCLAAWDKPLPLFSLHTYKHRSRFPEEQQ